MNCVQMVFKEISSEDIPSDEDVSEFTTINEMPHVKHRESKNLMVPRFFVNSKLTKNDNEIMMEVDSPSKSPENE